MTADGKYVDIVRTRMAMPVDGRLQNLAVKGIITVRMVGNEVCFFLQKATYWRIREVRP